MPDLLDLATPEIFARNAFRVLELPIDASDREIAKRGRIVTMALNKDLTVPHGPARYIDSPHSVTPEDVSEALQVLREPYARLYQELMWFWPVPGLMANKDEALAALRDGASKVALRIWAESQHLPVIGPVAMHNILVYRHQVILDRTLRQREPFEAIGQGQWHELYVGWRRLVANPGLWTYVRQRVRELNDPRVDQTIVARLQEDLPRTVAGIGLQLAVRAARRGNLTEARVHADLVHEAGFGDPVVAHVRDYVVKPARDQLRRLCEGALEQVRRDPKSAQAVVRQLLEQAEHPLLVHTAILPLRDPSGTSAHEHLATTVLEAFDLVPERNINWSYWAKALHLVFPGVVSRGLSERVSEAIEIAASYWLVSPVEAVVNGIFESSQSTFEKYNAILRDVLPLLQQAERELLGATATRNAVSGICAAALYRVAVELANEKSAYDKANAALCLAQKYAVEAQEKQRIDEALETVQSSRSLHRFGDELSKVMESGHSNAAKLIQVKTVVMHSLDELGSELGHNTKTYRIACNLLAAALQRLSAQLNNEDKAYKDAQDALTIAVKYVTDFRLRAQLIEGGRVIRENIGKGQQAQSECFIATAAFGTAMKTEVQTLRQYRDEILTRSVAGRLLIRVYYLISPPLAKVVSQTDFRRSVVRRLLSPIISVCHRQLEKGRWR